MAHNSHDSSSFAHPAPLRLLIVVFVILVGLTVLTVVAAKSELPVGRFEVWVAMGIATIKAALVAAIFMHLWWDKPFNIIVFLSSLIFVSLFVGFTLTDSIQYRDQVEIYPNDELPPKPVNPYQASDPGE
jgi:cytochrome c oxidase subunit IV